MDQDTRSALYALLVLLMALLQFLLRRGPQNSRVKDLETRLEEAETRLEDLEQRLVR